MDVANELLDAIEIIVDKKIRENTAQIYPGICKSVSGNSCVMSINGKDNTIQFYGSIPTVGSIYRVFVPDGNMSMAFAITGNDERKGLHYSNSNLLDNWYFGNPVNQRGQTEYTAAGYTIDRWKLEANGSVKSALVVNSGISLNNGDDTTYCNFAQIVEKLPAGTYIVSFLVDDFSNVNQVFCEITNTSSFTFDSNLVSLKFTLDADSDAVKIGIQKKLSGNALTVKAAKLELGSQQTLAHQDANGNWVLNEIPDYGEQLARCQRHQIPWESYERVRATLVNTSNLDFVIPTPVTMRTKPVINTSVLKICKLNGTDVDGFSFAVKESVDPGFVSIRATKNSHGLTDALLYVSTRSIIDANL